MKNNKISLDIRELINNINVQRNINVKSCLS